MMIIWNKETTRTHCLNSRAKRIFASILALMHIRSFRMFCSSLLLPQNLLTEPFCIFVFHDGVDLHIDTDHTILRSKTATFLLENMTAVTFFICHGFGVPRVLIGVLQFDMIRQKCSSQQKLDTVFKIMYQRTASSVSTYCEIRLAVLYRCQIVQ